MLRRLSRALAAAAAAAAWASAGPAAALSTPADFEFTLAPTASPVDFELALVLRRSFADVLTLGALIEPSWVPPAGIGGVVLGVSGSPSFAGALLAGPPDNPSYELAHFDGNGDLVLGTVTASAASPVTAFTWALRMPPQAPGSTLRATLNVEQFDAAAFDAVLLAGAQTFAAPVPEPATWTTLAAGLIALVAVSRRRGRPLSAAPAPGPARPA